MMNAKRKVLSVGLVFLMLISVSLLFFGCSGDGGGGGGDDVLGDGDVVGDEDDGNGSTILTGRFIDGAVSGLNYQTATQSGTTNASGEFSYLSGETVSFFIGDILLGQAAGAATVSPFDMAGISAPTTALEVRRAVNRMNASQVAPLGIAANIAVFLQTLDENDTLDDGIQIPDALHGLAEGMTVNFSQRWERFRWDSQFRSLLDAGLNAGLWSGTRSIVKVDHALDLLYAGLGLTPNIMVMETEDQTEGDYTYSYDGKGRILVSAYESDSGGDPSTQTYSYYPDGYLEGWVRDDENDGTTDSEYAYAYDSEGNRTSVLMSYLSGEDELITYEYNANGQLATKSYDVGNDGSVDLVYEYVYDASTHQITISEDDDNDGSVDSVDVETYDVIHGNRLLIERDSDNDGIVDERIEYTYDDNGNCTLVQRIHAADDDVWYQSAMAYDDDGNKTSETNSFSSYEYDYDENGNNYLREWTFGTSVSNTYYTFITYHSWAAVFDADQNIVLVRA